MLKRLTFCLVLLSCLSAPAYGESFRTRNFIATADTADLARELGERAEGCRRELALDWFGVELPPWEQPCAVSASVGDRLPVRGGTSFVFDGERPTLWQMQVQGPRSTLLRSVVPHEVTHTIFVTYVGRRLPRCLEEGACVSAEHRHDRGDLEAWFPHHPELRNTTTLQDMLSLGAPPPRTLCSYAHSYSLVRFLIGHGGKRKFVDFLTDGAGDANWASAARTHYGHATLEDLQEAWLRWAAPERRETPTLVAQAK